MYECYALGSDMRWSLATLGGSYDHPPRMRLHGWNNPDLTEYFALIYNDECSLSSISSPSCCLVAFVVVHCLDIDCISTFHNCIFFALFIYPASLPSPPKSSVFQPQSNFSLVRVQQNLSPDATMASVSEHEEKGDISISVGVERSTVTTENEKALQNHLTEDEQRTLDRQLDTPEVKGSFVKLYRYATKTDLIVIAVSSVCAIIAGVILPLMTVSPLTLRSFRVTNNQ